MAEYKRRVEHYYNSRVRLRSFKPNDHVLRRVLPLTRVGALGDNWEGPYKVLERVGGRAYRLEDLEGRQLGNPWNAEDLKIYFE